MNTTEWIIFIVLSLANIWLTWSVSLRQKRFHGIYRFISFECIFLLVLMNYPVWFSNPFAWYQVIISVINLLALYLTARVEEREMIRKFGQEYADYMKKTKMFIP